MSKQDALQRGSQPDKEQVPEEDLRQPSRQLSLVLPGIHQEGKEMPREQDTGERNHRDQQEPGAEVVLTHRFQFVLVGPAHVAGQHRNDRTGNGPLGYQAAKHIGDLEGELKGIGEWAGTEERGPDRFPQKPENSAQEGEQADGENTPQVRTFNLCSPFSLYAPLPLSVFTFFHTTVLTTAGYGKAPAPAKAQIFSGLLIRECLYRLNQTVLPEKNGKPAYRHFQEAKNGEKVLSWVLLSCIFGLSRMPYDCVT